MVKTNAMRLLDGAKIEYKAIEYSYSEDNLAGTLIADEVGLPYEQVFKTLVAKGDRTGFLVFCIPVSCEIDLKKAAQMTNNKKIEMLKVKDLLSVTGYIRGGCSPIGMKKKFPTYFDETIYLFDEISVSAGVRGCQIFINAEKLVNFCDGTVCDLTQNV